MTAITTTTAAAAPSLAETGSAGRAIRPLVWFVLLAYGWTWGIGAAAFLLMRSGTRSESVVGLLDTAAGFGPVVAALVVASRLGRAELTALLAALVRWRVSPVWYLTALYGPALVAVAGATAWFGPGALAYDRLWPAIVTGYLPRFVITLLTAGPIQEELGWRGFALPRLQRLLGPFAGTAALGVAWAAWHLPNVVFHGWDATTTALFLLVTVLTAFAYTWLVNNARGSVLLAMLLHAGINTSSRLVSVLVPERALAGLETTVYVVMALAYTVLVVGLLAVTRGRLGDRGGQGSGSPA
jgi:membrane protease YdiL (CAAX protease family)